MCGSDLRVRRHLILRSVFPAAQARAARQPVAAVVRPLGRSGNSLTSPATAASGGAIAIRQARDSVGMLPASRAARTLLDDGARPSGLSCALGGGRAARGVPEYGYGEASRLSALGS